MRWWRTWARSANVARSNRPSGAVGPLLRRPGGGGGGPVDADPDQLALRLGDLLGGLAEQGQRGAPRDQPAQVGRELPVEAEVQRAGHVPGGERGAGAQVDQPLPRLQPAAQRGLVRRLRGRSGPVRPGRRCWPGPSGRSRPARRPARPAAPRPTPARPGSGPGWCASPARSSRRWPRTGWRSRSCRTRGWAAPARRRAARRRAGAPRRTGGAPGRGCAPGRAGPGGRSSRTAATRRRTPPDRCSPSRRSARRTGGCRCAREWRSPAPAATADLDDVAVADRDPLVGHRVGGVDVVRRAGRPRQRQAAGDVVVVDVGLEDVGDPDAGLLRPGPAPGRCLAAGRPRRRPARRGPGSCGRPASGSRSGRW